MKEAEHQRVGATGGSPRSHLDPELRQRVWIAAITPQVEGGRWPSKAVVGEAVKVQADLVCDGHDLVGGAVLFQAPGAATWSEVPLSSLVNDRFEARFVVDRPGFWRFMVEAWVNTFSTWRRGLEKKVAAQQDVRVELMEGQNLVSAAADRAGAEDKERLLQLAQRFSQGAPEAAVRVALSDDLAALMELYPDRVAARRHEPPLEVRVDRVKARFSAWYEFFPRSTGAGGRHGTFKSAEAMLEYVASLGFDTVYLPPIHPIGLAHRKGRNNTLKANESDPGSPWAIGAKEGGHKSVHPQLGSLEDFRGFVEAARLLDLDVALDIAFQASPDHPYVKEHPEWFTQRPDGTIQYAENPPKKYQDIYPINFASDGWQALWEELRSVFEFWISHGVTVFRVDNPHTKPLSFWSWCLRSLQEQHPEVIFLSEAFTRPKLMYALAKAGFSQSYTYFTWRESKEDLQRYLEELTSDEVRQFFRPNFWPNTPDILPGHLQHGGRPAFCARLVLAATLSSNYGIYGPAYELMDHVPRPSAEEYLDNEKYELRHWNLDAPDSLRGLCKRLNMIRRAHVALQSMEGLFFHQTDNPHLICYSRVSEEAKDLLLIVVNLDFYHTQSGWLDLQLDQLGLEAHQSYQVHDLLSEERHTWYGGRNFVMLDPHAMPAHILRINRFVRRENDFDYWA